jgi:putative SOS response-associated peptidase YedK
MEGGGDPRIPAASPATPACRRDPMCGRFTLHASPDEIQRELGLPERPEHVPRYNIAPGQEILTVSLEEGRLAARPRRWGLVPAWAEDPAIGSRMINARSETVAEKPAFRVPFARRRCLVVADGFYEWKSSGAGKRPFHIRVPSGRPFAFAALWERWGKGRHPIESCTILTTSANERVRGIHERMPVILDAAARARWLAPDATREELLSLLRPFADDGLEAYEVSTLVNRPANDEPECLAPIAGDGPELADGRPLDPSAGRTTDDDEDRSPGDRPVPDLVRGSGEEQLPLL